MTLLFFNVIVCCDIYSNGEEVKRTTNETFSCNLCEGIWTREAFMAVG